jgi:copper chaperone
MTQPISLQLVTDLERANMIELEVTGMTCGHCEMAVRKALAKVPGVTAVVKVDRTANRAAVEGRPDVDALVAAVKAEGYPARAL